MKLIRPAVAQLVSYDGKVLTLTDHGRSPLSIDYALIENAQRMADGRMRKYVTASKKTVNFSWSNLPSLDFIVNSLTFNQIKSLKRVNGLSTIETLTSHGYVVGDIVRINNSGSYNGEYKITAVNGNTFSFNQTGVSNDIGPAYMAVAGSDKNVSSIKRLSGVTTITTSAAHGLLANDYVLMSLNNIPYNDPINEMYQVKTIPSSTEFTLDQKGLTDIFVVRGTITPNTESKITAIRRYENYAYFQVSSAVTYTAGQYVEIKNTKERTFDGIYKISGLTPDNLSFACELPGKYPTYPEGNPFPSWTESSGTANVVTNVQQKAVSVTGTCQKWISTPNSFREVYSGETYIKTYRSATTDGNAGGNAIKSFYEDNIYTPIKLNLYYSSDEVPTETNRITQRTFDGTDYKIMSRSRLAGVSTITINKNHGLRVGDVVKINHLLDANLSFNGIYTVNSVKSLTSFTYSQQSYPDVSATTSEDGYIMTITQRPTESFDMFLTSFNFTVIKRLSDMDYWDISLSMEEV